jgi:hypothetical protein
MSFSGRTLMRKISILACVLVAAAVFCGRASATVQVGVTEDAGKSDDGGVWFFSTLRDLGMTQNRITIAWDPSAPMTIRNQYEIDAWIPQAAIYGVQVVFAVVPLHARDLTSSPDAPAKFAQFCALLARTYPVVKDFVIGNEPNQPRFWQPQYDSSGHGVSGAAYEPVLAHSYDALKAVDPKIRVIGIGLSPRGNDNPRARDNVSISPTRFLRDLGVAYRASHRTKPLMDEFAFHPYPPQNVDGPDVGYNWPNIGLPDLARLKQDVWDTFYGTAQPTFQENTGNHAASGGLTLDLDEVGWEVAIPASLQPLYHGTETKRPIDEQTQAKYYSDTIRFVVCDPTVRTFSIFHLIDESDLERWQSGLFRVDLSKRPSYDAVKQAIHDTQGKCAGTYDTWTHTTSVINPNVLFVDALRRQPAWKRKWSLMASVGEEAAFRAGIFRVKGPKATAAERLAFARALAGRHTARPVLSAKGILRQNARRLVAFPRRRVKAGYYVYAVRLTATMNPARAKIYVARPIQVGTPRKRSPK